MKKIIFIAGVLAAQFASAQLYTPTGTVSTTSTTGSNNVGIGVHDPHSNLEVGDQNGGKITISTAGWSASSANPKFPILEFAGYLSNPKVRITATEESGNTNGSKFSILVNDNTSATNLVERFSILQNGNIGIGVNNAHSNLEVGDQNGGKITISTAGWSASSANPKYPALEFAGYLNAPKVKLTATEETGNTNGSKFSILVNDNTNATNLVERFSIIQNGNVGLGNAQPREKLDVLGNILAGATHSTEGINAFAIRYENGSLSNWGSLRSSAATYMSFGVKADPNTAEGWLSSNGSYNFSKIAMTMNNDGFSFFTAPYQQVAMDVPVSMKEVMKISPYGNALLQGKFEAKEIKVTLTPTADFVFEDSYDLPKLEEVARHIKEKKHLPEIASAKVMEKEGVNVGEFQIKLLQKIEELTLYVIEQNKQLKNQQEKIQQLETEKSDLNKVMLEIQQLKKEILKKDIHITP